MSRGKSNIAATLEELKKTDVYSLILFTIYKLKDIPEYSTLSELSYVLDNESLLNFLDYYGGTTIRVPTRLEFKVVVEALLLYQYVNIENIPFDKALKNLDLTEVSSKDVKEAYKKITVVIANYEFKRN